MIPFLAFSQALQTHSYRDTSLPYIELDPSHYNFAYPICSDILNAGSFDPPGDGVYLKATFGHRYLSNTTEKTDNHGGFDYWDAHTCNSVNYSSANPISINCMCDGVISNVINGPDSVLELTATGRSVQVTCDSAYQSLGGDIIINYRHLSGLGNLPAIADTATSPVLISKGDTIGLMGASGTTSQVHLHMSTQTTHPLYGSAFVHTARLFDPGLYPNVLRPLTHARIELLHDWPDSALFRVIWPFNQTITRFVFSNGAFNVVFDKEAAYDVGSATRDDYDCVPGVKVFAYQFNGKQTALSRYTSEKPSMPAVYPASPQRDANLAMYNYNHIPIAHDSVAYVYDFIIENLPASHDKDSFKVKLSDVWGYTVEGDFGVATSAAEDFWNQGGEIQVFPNPTSGMVRLDFGGRAAIRRIEVLDIFGVQVAVQTFQKAEVEFDLGGLVEGIYFLRVWEGDAVRVLKVVKTFK